MYKNNNAAWGYIPSKSYFKNIISKKIGYPHPLGRIAARIVRKFANFNSKHTLDIGCDAGVYTIEFLKRGVKKVSSIDINKQSIEVTKNNLKKFNLKADILHADGQKLPFKDNTFDQVICLMVLEHVKDPESLLREISRVLVDKGQLILSVPNELYLSKPLIPYDFSKILIEIEHEHPGYYLEDLEQMFRKNNLHIQDHHYYYKFFSKLISESIYIIIGVRRRKFARKNMTEASYLAMIVFILLYPFFLLDNLLKKSRGGSIIVKAINNID